MVAAKTQNSKLLTLRSQLARRTGFWRSLAEMVVVVTAYFLLFYPLTWLGGAVWFEIAGLLMFGFYAAAAWRLAPGQGSLLRRGARVLLWILLFSLGTGVLDWICLHLLPAVGRVYGIRFDEVELRLVDYLGNNLLVVLTLFVPARVLLVLWAAGRERLRWKLTFSYLLMGVLTVLLLPFALAIFVAISSLFIISPVVQPGDAAERVAATLDPLMRESAPAGQVDASLDELIEGSLRVPTSPDQQRRDAERRDEAAFSFEGIRRVTLLRPDGTVLASAGDNPFALDAAPPAEEQARLELLVAAVRGGGCTEGRPADGRLADSAACAIRDERGGLAATVVAESYTDARYQWGAAIGRILAFVLFGTGLWWSIVPIAIVVVLGIAVGAGSLLARGLTRRIEKLTSATSDVAAGNLDRQVEVESPDEVGRLSADFNTMAARLKERERALADTAQRAEALLEANRRLVANVSHELRTPLATLRGYVEALEHEHGDHLPAHDMEVIQAEVRRLTELIDDLFTLARAEAHQLPLLIETVDAAALAHRLVDTLAPLARRERQIEIVAALPDDLPPVRADPARLEQVLLNLLQNALRHTPPGGIVAVEGAAGDGATVALSIADTGVGIAPDELPLVFERFYRSDSSRARETGGAGLGLALVRELVAAMGGHVAAESQPGRGSRFSVTLQRAEQAVAELAA
jgi:signal transduction histidine kinase